MQHVTVKSLVGNDYTIKSLGVGPKTVSVKYSGYRVEPETMAGDAFVTLIEVMVQMLGYPYRTLHITKTSACSVNLETVI